MKKIGVLANSRKPHAADVLQRLAKQARAMGLELVTCDETGRLLRGATRVPESSFCRRMDVLMALGGDGTMLRAVRVLAGADTPVIGVNLGSLGFLTSITERDLDRALRAIQSGTFTTSIRAVGECVLRRRGKKIGSYRALNDAVIGWGASSRVSTLELRIDGEQVASYACDGLIVSTPTGSTGHSLSAGGPILHPESPCLIISPICPHTLSNRTLVISDRSVITVRVVKAMKTLLLSVDGQEETPVKQGDELVVKRSPRSVRFVHLPGYSYFSVLSQKLHWRGSNV